MIGDKTLGPDGVARVSPGYFNDVVDYIKDNHVRRAPEALTQREFFRMWLEWNGIKGYANLVLILLDQLGMLKDGA